MTIEQLPPPPEQKEGPRYERFYEDDSSAFEVEEVVDRPNEVIEPLSEATGE